MEKPPNPGSVLGGNQHLAIYPYLPRATVEKTSAKAYMRLLSSDAGEAA